MKATCGKLDETKKEWARIRSEMTNGLQDLKQQVEGLRFPPPITADSSRSASSRPPTTERPSVSLPQPPTPSRPSRNITAALPPTHSRFEEFARAVLLLKPDGVEGESDFQDIAYALRDKDAAWSSLEQYLEREHEACLRCLAEAKIYKVKPDTCKQCKAEGNEKCVRVKGGYGDGFVRYRVGTLPK
jgi:hypothetical protein